ncbi:MAG: hypothetical protein MUF22_09240, partial [Chitinispirillaceae bacterium]|nr:hypothetical protein [Chitinispirillaceae bacterium]
HLAYSDLSTSEKINYETVFAKNILQYLADAVPESVGFTSLVIDSFSIIKATGAAPSREVVTRLFNALRSDRLELRGAPYSSIRPNGNRGFTFVFCCDASFGVNPAEPYQTADHLEPHENLPAMLDRFKRLAADNKIVLKKGLQEVSIEASSGFRRHHYTLSAGGTYRNVVKFVLQADKAHLPCAFRTLRLKARSRAVVDIDANLIFTTGN